MEAVLKIVGILLAVVIIYFVVTAGLYMPFVIRKSKKLITLFLKVIKKYVMSFRKK